ncbi:transmembrane protein 138 isoform X1 [Monodelphis domestica]|uniref:transmembrane protein 138 isoform X1 n=1 Tax=Monodelphis domestica TaxID=13616 RepID=UPI0024E1EF2D|nr:transmembrane protein 138 isoform X1 [Monodelphis domestica]XP_007497677.2 transmembrane protein 138 isoform X1 [Monodelphis domestica]XP_007497678.2 transmembrane protein 138 isoform X1 [Monodelphis domestica]XP_056657612.1 transmembrane protein 138 isoform X1 [Monodelphis domestica]
MLQTSNYSLVLSLQLVLLLYDLLVNAFSELLRSAPVVQLVLFIIQDIAILFNVIIIFLMFFNTFVFQAGLINLLFRKFKGTIILTAFYLSLSIPLHVWVLLPCSIATSTRGQPSAWAILDSTRTLCGCAKNSPKSEADLSWQTSWIPQLPRPVRPQRPQPWLRALPVKPLGGPQVESDSPLHSSAAH